MMKFELARYRRAAAATAAAACTVLAFGVTPALATTTNLADVEINEVESNNDSVNGDWIELYNTGESIGDEVNIAGAILSDSENDHRFVIPSGTVLGIGEFAAFRVDDPEVSGSFGLGARDSARLFRPNTADLGAVSPVDSFSWEEHALTTYGAIPDGSDDFEETARSTFGEANIFDLSPIGNITGVVLNEVESNGDATNGDWVELYNTTRAAIDIDGAILTDSDPEHQFVVPASTPEVPALGYLAIRVDDRAVSGNFGLGAPDAVALYAPNDITLSRAVDSFSWDSHATVTYGRTVPGAGTWAQTSVSTRGTANQFVVSAPDLTGVVINEVESHGDDVHGDWIELKNTTDRSVDLDNAILSDGNNGNIFQIPASTPELEAGAVTAFRVDDPALGRAQFGLGDADSARLFRAGVGDLGLASAVDRVSWSTHAQRTYGLNDSRQFVATNKGTFGEENDFSTTVTPDISDVVLNEVVSTGDSTNGDWVELLNTTGEAIDISGAIISDSDDSHAYRIPDNTMLAAGDTYVVQTERRGGFGLGSEDAVRFFRAGTTITDTSIPLDHHEWDAHAVGSYARQLSGLGDWIEDSSPSYDEAN